MQKNVDPSFQGRINNNSCMTQLSFLVRWSSLTLTWTSKWMRFLAKFANPSFLTCSTCSCFCQQMLCSQLNSNIFSYDFALAAFCCMCQHFGTLEVVIIAATLLLHIHRVCDAMMMNDAWPSTEQVWNVLHCCAPLTPFPQNSCCYVQEW